MHTTDTTDVTDTTDLPSFPLARPRQCPFDPAADYLDWQRGPGIRQARLWNGRAAWVVTRYEDIRAVLSDPRISADATRPTMPTLTAAAAERAVDANPESTAFIRMDDPEHARLRLMVTRAFTARRVEAMRPQIQELVDTLLDEMVATGQPADLYAGFALPLPSTVIALLLGVPDTDHAFFQTCSNTLLDAALPIDDGRAAYADFTGYITDLIRRKEQAPGDDLISHLLGERVATGQLTRTQLASMVFLLLIAGHETTANMIALGTLALLRHPDQLARLRDTDDPALIAGGVEELLRYLSIVENPVTRVAAEDITVGGQLIAAGDAVVLHTLSGNRDPGFLDDPGSLDVGRSALGHLAFGYGVHQCVGQNLARVELQVALPSLLRRLPGLRLAVPFEDVRFRDSMAVYGVTRLPVAW